MLPHAHKFNITFDLEYLQTIYSASSVVNKSQQVAHQKVSAAFVQLVAWSLLGIIQHIKLTVDADRVTHLVHAARVTEVALLVWGDYGIPGGAAACYIFGLYDGDKMGIKMVSLQHGLSGVSLGCISGSVHGRFCCKDDRWLLHQEF